ncbi:MAG: peptidoglycan bridge formation glycyltransferase FemA/FemB family protein [Spirochaetota bacterium]
MHGLYRFKTGFGGRIIHYPGCWDVPLNSLLYKSFKTAEGFRKFYHKRLKKKWQHST